MSEVFAKVQAKPAKVSAKVPVQAEATAITDRQKLWLIRRLLFSVEN
jgi:hypothetical protein